MNIFIISYGRTGGTTFGKWLSLELGRRYIQEPFNQNHKELYKNIDYSQNKFVIKLEPEQIDLIKTDKKTIGLIRENTMDCAISHLAATYSNSWHSPYMVSNDWIESNKFELLKMESRIEEQNNKIKKMNYDILLTYENLYDTKSDFYKICDFFNIKNPKYKHLMDSKMKYRTFNKISKKNII